jgi:hypothetical protein
MCSVKRSGRRVCLQSGRAAALQYCSHTGRASITRSHRTVASGCERGPAVSANARWWARTGRPFSTWRPATPALWTPSRATMPSSSASPRFDRSSSNGSSFGGPSNRRLLATRRARWLSAGPQHTQAVASHRVDLLLDLLLPVQSDPREPTKRCHKRLLHTLPGPPSSQGRGRCP